MTSTTLAPLPGDIQKRAIPVMIRDEYGNVRDGEEVERLKKEVIERLNKAVDGRLPDTVLVLTTDVEDVLAHIQAQATALAERDAELEIRKTHAANHVETLRGVRDLCKGGDMERAIRWVTDGLSGYTDDGESVLLMVSDQRNKAEAERDELKATLARNILTE